MKTNSNKAITATIVALFTLQITFAQFNPKPILLPQTDWIRNGKDTIWTPKYIGIKTSSPDAPLQVAGEIIADSMRIFGPLKIGLNSMELNAVSIGGGGSSYDQITSSFGILNFGNTTSPFSNIRVGIGTTTPASGNALDVFGSIALFGYRVLASPDPTNIFVGVNIT